MTTTQNDIDCRPVGAAELGGKLIAGSCTAHDVTEKHLARIDAAQPRIRALTVCLADEARAAASGADQAIAECKASGTVPPPLCGIPITIKDCFDVQGAASTLGIDSRTNHRAGADSPLVARLRRSGAILLGKTNVPQVMLLHCCDNPVFGRTIHPADPSRGPGGSSGGEAAIIAAGGSVMGLGSDLGGSIRQPAHACGLVGFKPTSGRLTNAGSHRGLSGMESVRIDAGPIARSVEDAALMMQVLSVPCDGMPERDEVNRPWRDYRAVDVAQLNIAIASTDNWFDSTTACQRAVREANLALTTMGANTTEVALNDTDRAMRLYFGLVSADGFRSIRRLLKGSRIDWQVRRQGWFAGMPRMARIVLATGLRLFGQKWLAKLLRITGPRSADAYWQLTTEARRFAEEFWQQLDVQSGKRVDALVLPPHALPALRHGTALDLLPAGSYCYLGNLLGTPAGVVPWTTVRENEQSYSYGTKTDLVAHLASRTMERSAGLPIGVQVIARCWDDDVVLAVMAELERCALRTTATRGWAAGAKE